MIEECQGFLEQPSAPLNMEYVNSSIE